MKPKVHAAEQSFYISNLHCAACKKIIEDQIRPLPGILFCRVSLKKGMLRIGYAQGAQFLTAEKLNEQFRNDSYRFSLTPLEKKALSPGGIMGLAAGGALLAAFFVLSDQIQTDFEPGFFSALILGLLAGFSSCAALTGGILIALNQKWNTEGKKGSPYLAFLLGRLISYGFFGAVLGWAGSRISLSSTLSLILILAVSAFMILTAFQMLGFSFAQKFSFSFFSKPIKTGEKSSFFPFLSGFFTFLLPCGFTLTVQGMGLVSGSAATSSLLLLAFAAGTLPGLFFIGFFSAKWQKSTRIAPYFSKAAGVLLIFFALFQIKNQMNVLGFTFVDSLTAPKEQQEARQSASIVLKTPNPLEEHKKEQGLVPLSGGRQILKMDVSAYGYSPNFFKVRLNVPARFEIADRGASGCTNAIIAPSLFKGEIPVGFKKVSIKDFIPRQKGFFRFTCWMGMVSGTIQAVDDPDKT